MIKLSDRLQRIADRIEDGETMADIGCDHGFLPIYLRTTGKCPMTIIADVSGPSLEKARENAGLYADALRHSNCTYAGMDFRVGDGLSVLSRGEVDSVVIAGMGGKLIRDILAADLSHTTSFHRFILQPRIGQGHLRKWLTENGFSIIAEDLVYEGKYIPEIITAISPRGKIHDGSAMYSEPLNYDGKYGDADGDDVRWRIPPWIVKAQGPVEDFLMRQIAAEQDKLKHVKLARTRELLLEEKIAEGILYLDALLEQKSGKGRWK